MKEELKIFICTHKKYNILSTKYCTPLFLGESFKEEMGYYRDSTGNNISLKNKNYSELTGLYWIWKNTDYRYIGLFHYRRYLKLRKRNIKNIYYLNYNESLIKKLMKNIDIILPKLYSVDEINVEEQYKTAHLSED
ncbi:DUF4422 domain-containing protein [Fusobacterium mortiferum]|jgi:hypothetical protein|uniref:DUF4422 domain-containing protein n=1 Tax=Fusobacterium mortiferum TaxID=850 RepID=UPI000E44D42B|nr:DUF4422 domain-containing protein [Fusobacterium mortiferum]RGN01210.1 DUF4422 domain-containing protein [Fusobacterium mortiferum]